MTHMLVSHPDSGRLIRLAVLLLVAVAPGWAEFLHLEVAFEGIGCASCIESLDERLLRLRGVERVDVDALRSIVTLDLEAGNRVRLESVLSRITQDGTKVLRSVVTARGTITAGSNGLLFEPSGLKWSYRVRLDDRTTPFTPQPDVMYKVRGTVPAGDPGAQAVLGAESVEAETSP